MSETKIRQRHEIPVEDTWATEDMFVSDEAWEAELASLAADQAELVSYAGKLGNSGKTLYDYLYKSEQTDVKIDLLANYAMRKGDQDTRNPVYQAMGGKLRSVLVALSAACSFETPEIMAISDEDMERFYAECPELERYRRSLTNTRRFKEHTLTAAEEKLLAAAGEISSAPTTVYGMFNNADITFADAEDSQGNKHPITHATYIPCVESSDRVLRKNAYESLYAGYNNYKNTAAGLLNAQHKQLKFFAESRHYPSSFDAALFRTNVPTSVYLNLIEAVHQNMDKMYRYVRLRKKLLGVDELHYYDLYTPLVSGVDKEIPYEQAKQTIYEGLAPLGEEYRSILKKGFDSRWIDVYPNAGKRSGAYSAGAKVHPYVLMNYSGTLDSQFTLAHEMGHALHSYYSNKNQNPVDSGYVIFVAEVASTCNEALLMEHLLSKTTDKMERIYLINHFLDQF